MPRGLLNAENILRLLEGLDRLSVLAVLVLLLTLLAQLLDLGHLRRGKLRAGGQLSEDDLVAFWATWSGTQDGPMGPFPATGKKMELDFGGLHRVADGKIVESWMTWDNLTGLTQVGLYPPEPPEEAISE